MHVILFVAVMFLLKPLINRKTVTVLLLVVGLLIVRESRSLKRIYQFELNEKEKTYSIELYKGKSENVVIPSKYKNKRITIIGTFAFNDEHETLVRIKKVKIPNTIKRIEACAFTYNHLEEIEIPESVVFIGNSAFERNYLKNIDIPNSVKTIEAYAFDGNKLKKVEIPDSVEFIGKDAFVNNKNLVIYGNLGSEAERYAKSEGISFKELK